jgi:hypothetical protein
MKKEHKMDKDEVSKTLDSAGVLHVANNSEKTNNDMYKEIWALFQTGAQLDFETIDQTFSLANRSNLDLRNLSEYIVAMTLVCGSDILKAKLGNDEKAEKRESEKHAKRCKLMSVLLEAIDSELYSR